MIKRLVHRATPDARALREAMKAALQHLDYTDYLLDHRHWLGGATMTLADLAAAAQISFADYLGGIDWKGQEATAGWYRGCKDRRGVGWGQSVAGGGEMGGGGPIKKK